MSFFQSWSPFRQALRIAKHPKLLAVQIRLSSLTPVRFLINVLEDYKSVLKDSLQDIKARPAKAAVIFSVLAVAYAAKRTNPSQLYFRDICMESSNDLIQVPPTFRKPDAENYLREVQWLKNQNCLEFHNFGLFSVVLRRDFSDRCDIYEARCKYLEPPIEKVTERLVDVGIFNRWIFLNKAMKDFDVPD